jgi:hypothetical protein
MRVHELISDDKFEQQEGHSWITRKRLRTNEKAMDIFAN